MTKTCADYTLKGGPAKMFMKNFCTANLFQGKGFLNQEQAGAELCQAQDKLS